MESFIIMIVSLVLLVGFCFLVKKNVVGKDVSAAVISLLGYGVAAFFILRIWGPLARNLSSFVSGLAGISPFVPFAVLSVIAGLLLLLAWQFVKMGLDKLEMSDLGKTIVKYAMVGLWIWTSLSVMRIQGISPVYVAMLSSISLLFVCLGLGFIGKWYTENQRQYSVGITYVLCLGLTSYLSWMVGTLVGVSFFGSAFSMAGVLSLNLAIFWMAYGIGNGSRDPINSRVSTWILRIWLLFLICVSGYISFLQATNRLTIQELDTMRAYNNAVRQFEDYLRTESVAPIDDVVQKLENIKKNKGLAPAEKKAAMQQVIDEMKSLDDKQREIPKADMRLPKSIEAHKKAVEDFLKPREDAVKGGKKSAQTSSFGGKKLNLSLKPGEVYTVDNLKTHQEWSYTSFTGEFSHRVDEGSGRACWKQVENTLPWSADTSGKLEVKAGNRPVTLEVVIREKI